MTTNIQPTKAARAVSFANKYGAAAKQAAASLHVPAAWVLAQWGEETNFGAQPNMGANNPGNIMSGSTPANFATSTDFVQSYVASVKNDFGYFSGVHTGATSPAQVFGTNQDYAYLPNGQLDTQYGTKVQGAYDTLKTALAGVIHPTTSTAYTLSYPGASANNAAVEKANYQSLFTQPTTVLGSVTGANPYVAPIIPSTSMSLITRIVYIVVGVVLLIIGVLLMVGDAKMAALKQIFAAPRKGATP